MNEEEKFVIKTLKDSQNAYIENTKVKKVELSTDEAKVVLNLIEKQSKEIEELKKQLDLDNECEIALNNRIMDLENVDKKWENKIKAKIEEIQQRKQKDGECELALHGFQREAKIEVLQSLL